MKFTILLFCIALGVIALVDASVVDLHQRRAGELRKRLAERNNQASVDNGQGKKTTTATGTAAAKGNGFGGSNTSNNATATATVANKGKGKNKGTTSSTTSTTDTAAAASDTATATTTGTDNGGSNTCLAANALQTGSEITGQEVNATAGQVDSQTSNNNFINVCAGQTLTNGKQVVTGSCNGIPLGFIPAKQNMPSSLITFPEHNQDIAADTTFQIAVTQVGMELGSFTNAQLTYYSAPTFLNNNGLIIGHTHVTVQDLGGSFTPSQPLDPTKFAFFLGINTPSNAQGQVFANVPNGLPAGFYRVCTMVANANHSPLQMPVAQRGAQDDCHYFSVGQGSGNAQADSAAAASNSSSTTTTTSATSTATASATSTTTSAAAANTKGKGGKKGGKLRI